MADNSSFRSAFKGFNREDVVGYIAGLMEKIAAGEKTAAALQEQLEAKETECGALQENLEQMKTNFAALEEKYAALEQEREAQAQHSEELDRKCREYDKQSKANEEKLGAAMLDAKRFSEMLVKEANDRAGEVYQNAFAAVSDSAVSAKEIEAKMKTLSEEFDSAMGDMRRTMRELIGNMSKFKESVQDNGARFVYRSEFSGDADD